MKRMCILITVAVLCGAAQAKMDLATVPMRDTVQLTIYNSADLTLVREQRDLTLKQGMNKLQFSWANTLIDPTSLEMIPKANADKITIQDLVFPPRVQNLGLWNVNSGISGRTPVEISYLTSGLSWRAFYMGTLTPDESKLRLQGYVRVTNNSGEDYENAETRLVVGEINLKENIANLAQRKWPYDRSMPEIEIPELMGSGNGLLNYFEEYDVSSCSGVSVELFGCDKKEIVKQALSEYQLYTIEGRETIPDGWSKRLPSFDVQEIGVTNLYKYDEERWNTATMRFLSFANTEACKLGKNPLPDGYVRVFRTGRDGSPGGRALPLSYIGASGIKYIPVGEEVELKLGIAKKVKVEPKLMTVRYENHTYDQNGNVRTWDELGTWTLEISNSKNIPVNVEIIRSSDSTFTEIFCKQTFSHYPPNFGQWEIETDAPYEKYDATHFRFNIRIEPHSKKHIQYTLTMHNERLDDEP